MHYRAILPSLFEMVLHGLGAANLAEHARVIVDKPFGRDLAPTWFQCGSREVNRRNLSRALACSFKVN